MANDRSQARCEAAVLLGVDIEHLSAADSLRVDMVSALRLVIDSEQAGILSGGGADLGKLNVAVQSLIALLPGASLPEPASSRPDPREHMWKTYLTMRQCGQIPEEGLTQAKINAQAAEIERLKGELAEALAVPTLASPLPDNVVTLPRPPTERTTERSVVSPNPPAASAPVLGNLVCDPSPDESWKSYVVPDGSIRSTPRGPGQYWGPV
jgi:hypothetical protein